MAALVLVVTASAHPAFALTSDNGDGTFTSPILNADYPDADITRAGSGFSMLSTTFVKLFARHTSLMERLPVSASRKMPTICSSVNRFCIFKSP
jgi:hypothetical protein